MGQTESRERQHLRKSANREYRLPEARLKNRYDASDVQSSTTAYEASIDKYDYLIVFPLTEGPYADPLGRDAKVDPKARINWTSIGQIWFQAVRGTEEDKKEALDELKKYWAKRTGSMPTTSDSVLVTAWLTIAREAIVNQLSQKSGLLIKMSANSKYIFCRIRAPVKLLELQADKENYRLEVKGEIDPGSADFWNKTIKVKGKEFPVELEEEKRIYTKEEATTILEKLYRAGKISPNDVNIDSQAEKAEAWSKRIHALERIADKVPVYNKYPAYLKFSSLPHYRYLFQTYPSVRGKTLFRVKDRLHLTLAVINRFFDLEVFVADGVIETLMALHDASRGERVTVEVLQRRWVSFWRVAAREVGCPYVTHTAYDDQAEASWYLRPFSQPLGDIRDYFGEKIAIFYSWLGYYTLALVAPSIFSIVIIVIYAYRGYVDTTDEVDYVLAAFALFVIIWASIYRSSWDRECYAVQLRWGMQKQGSGYHMMADRPQFRGAETHRSFVTNQLEATYPESQRSLKIAQSWLAILVLLTLALGLIYALFYFEAAVLSGELDWDFDHFDWVVAVCIAFVVQFNSFVFRPLARILNDSENYKTDDSYEAAMISKFLIFQLSNNFAALLFTSYAKEYVFDSCSAYGCMYDLRVLLVAIIALRLLGDVCTMGWPYFRQVFIDQWFRESEVVSNKMADRDESSPLNQDENMAYVDELRRHPYEGTLISYADSVVQFGFVNWYAMAMPPLALCALLENMFKIRLDAWTLCSYTRRPHVQLAEDMAVWSNLMELLALMACVNNAGVLVFTSTSFDEYDFSYKVILFLIMEQCAVLFKILASYLVTGQPSHVEEIANRQTYIVDKYTNMEDNDDNIDLANLRGNLDDTVDVEGLSLYDIRKTREFTEMEYERMEELEAKRRELLSDVRLLKNQLTSVYKSETLNEVTGIGETKHGLPLGRLSVKLVEIQRLTEGVTARAGVQQRVKVRIAIKGARQSVVPAGPPLSPKSDSNVVQLVEGSAILNQSLGPFAPISTQDADVVFEVIDMSRDANEASCATGSIKLRDINDQNSHDKVLYLKIRDEDGNLEPSDARIFVSMQFQYSKVVPIRNRIYEVQDRLRLVERELAQVKAGRGEEVAP